LQRGPQLILDDSGLDAMDATESRDIYEPRRWRSVRTSIVLTSNRGPDEWLAAFADPVRAQAGPPGARRAATGWARRVAAPGPDLGE
jgi:hypothetical protein